MIKRYILETPEQLRELYAICPEGNQSMDNLARVWRAQCVFASAHYSNPMPVGLARVDFDTKARTATVCKTSVYHLLQPRSPERLRKRAYRAALRSGASHD